MDHLRQSWSALHVRALPSWRPLHTGPWWSKWDAVIAVDRNREGRHYEVYSYGQIAGTAFRLADAKDVLEIVYGPLPWKRIALPKEEALHYFFGWTTEFSDPTTIYVVDDLPWLG